MDSGDVSSSLGLLEELLSFSRRLAQDSYAIYELQFNMLAYGSWLLVAGTRKRRAQLSWDGRDFVLTCAVSEFPNSSSQSHWQSAGSRSLPPPSHTSVFAAAEQLVFGALGA